MSENHTDKFFETFSNAFRQVLSQCSGVEWSTAFADFSELADVSWVRATASGALQGDFAIALSPQSGILLAQALMMSDQPAADYGEEEKEAAIELLRQVCGLCSTALANSGGQPNLTVNAETPLAWTPAEQRTIQMTKGERSATLNLAISPELRASLAPRPSEPQSERPPQPETDRSALQKALATKNLDLLMDVRLGVRLRFGSRRMRLREVLEFHAGTIVELDRQVQEPVDLLVDSKLIARGEVVIVDGNYGLKVTDVLSPKQCVEALY